jgi:hypothetical protein
MVHSAEVAFIVSAVERLDTLNNTTRRRAFLLAYRIDDRAIGMPSTNMFTTVKTYAAVCLAMPRTCVILALRKIDL